METAAPDTNVAHRQTTRAPGPLSYRVSTALAAVAAVASAASFLFWGVLERDTPMSVGNMRGTALAMLTVAVPLLTGSMVLARRGSVRARFVWLGSAAYIAYNAVMFCFAVHFNSFFLLYAALLALSFWALLTTLRDLDLEGLAAACSRVPARTIAAYMVFCIVVFGLTWLRDIMPATVDNVMPVSFEGTGLIQNPIYVLDFAFTFPLLAVGAWLLWRRRPWGYVLAGTLVAMLTIETAGIAVDQVFGHRHDPSASLGAVPIMLGFTLIGLVFSLLFLRRVDEA